MMAEFRIGTLKNVGKKPAAKPVRVVPQTPSQKPNTGASKAVGGAVVSLGALVGTILGLRRMDLSALTKLLKLGQFQSPRTTGFGFIEGFVVATAICLVAGGVAAQKFSRLLSMGSGVGHYPARKKMPKTINPDTLLQRGFLDPLAYHNLPLAEKHLIAPNVYRLVFELPTPDSILGLPIGQHVAIKATIDGTTVQRSYTPTSNNADKGKLELVVKVYPDGLLTGRYLANLAVGDEVPFRGPKGAMRYRRGLAEKIGMLAGGTGITPMFQLIRAICEDDRDTTEVSLVYANRTERDILLRDELEAFARRYPGNLKLYYVLDSPPERWTGGAGFVTKELMADRFAGAGEHGSKVMLCGPPGMVNAAKKGLGELGYELPGAAARITDQVFCF